MAVRKRPLPFSEGGTGYQTNGGHFAMFHLHMIPKIGILFKSAGFCKLASLCARQRKWTCGGVGTKARAHAQALPQWHKALCTGTPGDTRRCARAPPRWHKALRDTRPCAHALRDTRALRTGPRQGDTRRCAQAPPRSGDTRRCARAPPRRHKALRDTRRCGQVLLGDTRRWAQAPPRWHKVVHRHLRWHKALCTGPRRWHKALCTGVVHERPLGDTRRCATHGDTRRCAQCPPGWHKALRTGPSVCLYGVVARVADLLPVSHGLKSQREPCAQRLVSRGGASAQRLVSVKGGAQRLVSWGGVCATPCVTEEGLVHNALC